MSQGILQKSARETEVTSRIAVNSIGAPGTRVPRSFAGRTQGYRPWLGFACAID
jgi:hypothetical protein